MGTMRDDDIQAEARALHDAERARRQIRQTTQIYPDMTLDDAYAVQRAWMDIKQAEGRRLRGHKIGLTSRAMQQTMRIDEPDHGSLLDDMFIADGADIDAGRFMDPRIEVELAFVLKSQLTGDAVSMTEALAATDWIVPALELIDARSYRVDPETQRSRTVFDTIADNAANAGVILGGRPIRPQDVDLRWVCGLLYRNAVIEESGVAAAVLNHPANGIAWLARKLAAHQVALEPGQVILSGSFTRPVKAFAGDVFHADFGALGSISCRFV